MAEEKKTEEKEEKKTPKQKKREAFIKRLNEAGKK